MLSTSMQYEPVSKAGGRPGRVRPAFLTSCGQRPSKWSGGMALTGRPPPCTWMAEKLKRRLMAAGAAPDKTLPPAFVAIMVPQAVGGSECTVKLEGRNGKLRIHWKGATAVGTGRLEPGVVDAAS